MILIWIKLCADSLYYDGSCRILACIILEQKEYSLHPIKDLRDSEKKENKKNLELTIYMFTSLSL